MTPLSALEIEVAPDWIDYNGHMNDACYAIAFSKAGDAFIEKMGLGPDERATTKRSMFTLAIVIRFIAEAVFPSPLRWSMTSLQAY